MEVLISIIEKEIQKLQEKSGNLEDKLDQEEDPNISDSLLISKIETDNEVKLLEIDLDNIKIMGPERFLENPLKFPDTCGRNKEECRLDLSEWGVRFYNPQAIGQI